MINFKSVFYKRACGKKPGRLEFKDPLRIVFNILSQGVIHRKWISNVNATNVCYDKYYNIPIVLSNGLTYIVYFLLIKLNNSCYT